MGSFEKQVAEELRGKKKMLVFDLHQAFADNADWFTAHLFRLIHKADRSNRERLRMAFPDEVAVFDEWIHATDEKLFFDSYIPDRRP